MGHFVVTMTNGEEWWMHPNFKKSDIAVHRGYGLALDQQANDGTKKTFKRLRNEVHGNMKLHFAPNSQDWRKTVCGESRAPNKISSKKTPPNLPKGTAAQPSPQPPTTATTATATPPSREPAGLLLEMRKE